MQSGQHARRPLIPGMLLIATLVATPIGMAPSASAKGVMLPRNSCTGPEIVNGGCAKAAQPVPTHILTPHGSKLRKMAIATERQQGLANSDCAKQSSQGQD
jgi:hypothetical protein